MNKSKVFLQISVGIDISKDDFKVCMMGRLADKTCKIIASSRFANSNKGFVGFWKWTEKHGQKHPDIEMEFLMEATGVYHENLAWFLYEEKQAKVAFFRSEGFKSKNDKIDAQGLAKMSLSKSLKVWKPISPVLHRLRTQTRQHESLQKALTRVGNQLHALKYSHLPDQVVIKQLEKNIVFLAKQIVEIKTIIEKTPKEDQKFYQRLQHITSIYGVGLLTAATVVAETNGFALFTSQTQLTSFAGYDIVEKQSGKHFGKTRISKKGNTHIRRILFMPAFHIVKIEGLFQDLYNRVFERTKIKMKAYTAVQRKLLCLMFTLWKKEEDFDADYYKNNLVEEDKLPLHVIDAH